MPDFAYIARSVRGAWRLARLDPGGMADFDITVPGFWRSFQAALIVAPIYVILRYPHVGVYAEAGVDPGAFVVVETLSYALDWIIFPLVMVPIAMMLGVSGTYVPFIIASNWASVIQAGAFLPFALVERAATGGIGGGLTLIVSFLILFYQWYVTRIALGVQPVVAVGLVILSVLLGLMLDLGTDAVLGYSPGQAGAPTLNS